MIHAIHRQVLAAHGGGEGVRDQGLLESAVAAPQATMMGESVFGDSIEMAGAYLFYLCRNHPFIDGNKRVALAACLVFMVLNRIVTEDWASRLDTESWEAFVLDVAASKLDREQATARLRSLLPA